MPCDKMAPIAKLEASVVKINGLLKSGKIKIGSDIIKVFKISKAFCCSEDHENRTFFFNNEVKGIAIFAKLCMNLR